MPRDLLVVAAVGQRVRAKTKDGRTVVGTIVKVDDSTFPGTVHVREDNAQVHVIEVAIGLPD